MGDNNKALNMLNEALKYDKNNDRIYFNLALLYNEMGNSNAAMENLRQAIALKSQNPRVYYNYGILLQNLHKIKEAEKIYQQGIAFAPNNLDLHYALSILYLQSNDRNKALPHLQFLKANGKGNQMYMQLVTQSGI